MRYGSYLVLAGLVASAGPVYGATVIPVEGPVSVNTGTGFQLLRGDGEVVAGDRLLVAEGGKAKISFSATCSAEIPPGIYVVPIEPVCQGGGINPSLVLGGAVVAGSAAAVIYAVTRPASP